MGVHADPRFLREFGGYDVCNNPVKLSLKRYAVAGILMVAQVPLVSILFFLVSPACDSAFAWLVLLGSLGTAVVGVLAMFFTAVGLLHQWLYRQS